MIVKRFVLLLLLLTAQTWGGEFDKEIAEVKSGVRKEARASWWGFDKNNATAALQNAINSGAEKVIIDHTGSDWIIDPVFLVSNQEVIIGRNVTVRARSGGFIGVNDALFNMVSIKNVIIRGEPGAVLKMNRRDYDDRSKYKFAEWRHILNLLSSENIEIRDLKLVGSGGDGIYLGVDNEDRQLPAPAGKAKLERRINPNNYCKNIRIENVETDDCHRQGISVISAESLLITNCRLNNTRGTAPKSGIDFEPNYPGERLVECIVENSTFSGNDGCGVEVYVGQLNGDSEPVSILCRNLEIRNNFNGIRIGLAMEKAATVKGFVAFADCRITDSKNITALLNSPWDGFQIKFINCQLDNSTAVEKAAFKICLMVHKPGLVNQPFGGLQFSRTVLTDTKKPAQPFDILLDPTIQLGTIAGELIYNGNPYDLAAFTATQKQIIDKLASMKYATLDGKTVVAPAGSHQVPQANSGNFFFRHSPVMLLLVEEPGKEISVQLAPRKLGNNTRAISITLKDPNGKVLKQEELAADGKAVKIDFVPETQGLYRLEADTRRQLLGFESAHSGQAMLMGERFQLVSPSGKLYFEVPQGVEEFFIPIWGDYDEYITASLVNPQGIEVQKETKFDQTRIFYGKRKPNAPAEIWAIDFKSAVEDVSIQFQAPLLPLLSANPNVFLRSK